MKMRFTKAAKLIFAGLLLLCLAGGCEKSEPVENPNLYKGDSIEQALLFIGVEPNRLETFTNMVRFKNSSLAEGEFYDFANNFANINDINDFLKLLCPESRLQIDNSPHAAEELDKIKEMIDEARFPGQENHEKVMALAREFEEKDNSPYIDLAVQPTHVMNIFHYFPPKKMVIGKKTFLIKTDSQYQMVFTAPSQFRVARIQLSDDLVELRDRIHQYTADNDSRLPDSLADILTEDDDGEFIERANALIYLGARLKIDDTPGTIYLYCNEPALIGPDGYTGALKLGDKSIWSVNIKDIPGANAGQ